MELGETFRLSPKPLYLRQEPSGQELNPIIVGARLE